ncbi:S-adenosyl-L-homocysteine hydrolase, putative [Babesia ovata]|uniref:S-adenosyl-L-homocysteine hydrolase, putative n=1 Tax=Babesia ovata TaxID=189622 RepID=A0A2H6KJ75_9APIC|nr:S-adenosyl-L-homocysteine hydrolase, putative [Babesia ovata]GBE63036.1 S-adenosyl-L-homocysteine hydrolase, putative [Babesia ovata]
MRLYFLHKPLEPYSQILVDRGGQRLQLLRDLRGEGREQRLDGGDVVAAGAGGEKIFGFLHFVIQKVLKALDGLLFQSWGHFFNEMSGFPEDIIKHCFS